MADLNFSKSSLCTKLRRFLNANGETLSTLELLENWFGDHRISAVLFGGLLRDVMIFGTNARPRDIDIVADTQNLDGVARAFQQYLKRATRFGGLQLEFNGVRVDIWPLSETWAFKTGLVRPPTFAQLPRTTFLTVEAITLRLGKPRSSSCRVYEHTFFRSVKNRSIDVNLEENPFPQLCVVRALLTAIRLRFRISRRLAQYVVTHAKSVSASEFDDIQCAHYDSIKCEGRELLGLAARVKSQLTNSRNLVDICSDNRGDRCDHEDAGFCSLQ